MEKGKFTFIMTQQQVQSLQKALAFYENSDLDRDSRTHKDVAHISEKIKYSLRKREAQSTPQTHKTTIKAPPSVLFEIIHQLEYQSFNLDPWEDIRHYEMTIWSKSDGLYLDIITQGFYPPSEVFEAVSLKMDCEITTKTEVGGVTSRWKYDDGWRSCE